MTARPLLTIAIPTFMRADYLALNLNRLHEEHLSIDPDDVEFIVSDNASTDDTSRVVEAAQARGLPILYHRWDKNIGSDLNIAEVFNRAEGRYVLILGDDDILTRGCLAWLVASLRIRERGVICLRPFGYDRDPDQEKPSLRARDLDDLDAESFLIKAGPLITLISACVINKQALGGVDARQFAGTNLVQVDLVIRAALAGQSNMMTRNYRVACKRNNSGGYDVFDVFVGKLGDILDSYMKRGLSADCIQRFGSALLIGFFPQHLLRALRRHADINGAIKLLRRRYGRHVLFTFCIAPIACLPRRAAILWMAIIFLTGRLVRGDFRRGVAFLRDRFTNLSY